MSRHHAAARGVVVVACAVLTGACAGAQDADVAEAASGLLEAVESGDGAAACSLLAPAVRTELEDTSGQSCERAVLEEPLKGTGPAQVRVFDTAAQAVIGSQTVFLSRFDGRWLVIAAACTPVANAPYDCSIGMP